MAFRDVRTFTEPERWTVADRAKELPRITLPRLALWNYDPCAAHLAQGVQRWCPDCGGDFRSHQNKSVAWLYLAKHGFLGDSCGTGKTISILGVLAMMAEAGELGSDEYSGQRRAVIVCKAAAVTQWREEMRRFVPSLRSVTATGTQAQRLAKYGEPWDVLVISYQMLASQRNQDLDWLERFRLGLVVYDDVDPMRNPENRTAYAVSRLCTASPRAIGVHATPLQKRVMELHSFLAPVGGVEMLGSSAVCKHRFVRVTNDVHYTTTPDGRQVQRRIERQEGIKNAAEFRRLVDPLVMRRTAADLDDVDMPEIQPSVVWLELSPEQARRYRELRRGLLVRLRDESESITQPEAMASFMHGWQICSGLATLDAPELGDPRNLSLSVGLPDRRLHDSVKLDWAADRIDGDMAEDKVVVFINFKPNIADMSARLDRLGIGHVIIWGMETNPEERHARLTRFRRDPSCRVLLGTTSIEQSLNLQVARHLIAVDTIINPARMTQLAGRVQRDGSRYSTVYFHQLLLRGTHEEAILGILRREQALADYVWDEQSQIFDGLSPVELMTLITGDPSIYQRSAA